VHVHVGITSGKHLWKHVCVRDSCGESKSPSKSKGILRTILRPRGRAKPTEIEVLHQLSAIKCLKWAHL
jgi:hypothetical protein